MPKTVSLWRSGTSHHAENGPHFHFHFNIIANSEPSSSSCVIEPRNMAGFASILMITSQTKARQNLLPTKKDTFSHKFYSNIK